MNCCDAYGDCQQGRHCPARVARHRPCGQRDGAKAEEARIPQPKPPRTKDHIYGSMAAAEADAFARANELAEQRWATAWVMAGVGLVATAASCLGYLVCALGLL